MKKAAISLLVGFVGMAIISAMMFGAAYLFSRHQDVIALLALYVIGSLTIAAWVHLE